MKTLKIKSAIVIFLTVIGLNITSAENPKYKLTTDNPVLVSPNVYEFGIYLQHTNPGESKFEYILGQYFFDFNPGIANGGILTYSITGSDLPQMLQPRNPTVSGNLLRLVVNSVPSKENLPQISDKSPGTLIARMRLETSAKSFTDAGLNLKLRTGPENPFTKIFAYADNRLTDVTGIEEFTADNISAAEDISALPKEFILHQNYPNPFNPSTSINYELPITGDVNLKIFDMTGKEIATLVNERQNAGNYTVQFNGNNFASGVYFYRIKAGEISHVKKMILIK